jgi:hypothetical protein
LHFADQPLHRLTPPDLKSTLKRTQIPGIVSIRIPRLEVDQEVQRGLIGLGVQTLKHLCPMRLERVGSPAGARFGVPVNALADHYTPRSSIVTPESDSMDKGAE